MNPIIKLQSLMNLGEGIHSIAISGGPCSGKTTGLAKLVSMLSDRGYKVLVSPESATKFITSGVRPWEIPPTVFQRQILLDTLMQEERFMEAARAYRDMGHKVVILCDRGAMDGQAYMGTEEFAELVSGLGLVMRDICEHRYHAVIHLRTAALGAEEFYTLANNEARKETPEEARGLDQRTLEAWQRHHHPRVIDNSTGFDQKIERLLKEVCAILGDPEPIEKEQKYLIETPNLELIPVHKTESRIVQDYLADEGNGSSRRVRLRSDSGGTSYFYTEKRKIAAGESFEMERLIGEREYVDLLKQKDHELHSIVKKRVTFFYENQFIEVDLFDGPGKTAGLALMEIEQTDSAVEPMLPPFIKVMRNVTGDEAYLNRTLAKG